MVKSIELFKRHNIRVTHQRLEVYAALLNGREHLTAEEIHEKIKPSNPAISLATIYAVLDVLNKKGLVNEVRIRFDKSSYEARTDWHHHFLCKQCDSIIDIDIVPCPSLRRKRINGHKIEQLQGYFYGTCKNCQGR